MVLVAYRKSENAFLDLYQERCISGWLSRQIHSLLYSLFSVACKLRSEKKEIMCITYARRTVQLKDPLIGICFEKKSFISLIFILKNIFCFKFASILNMNIFPNEYLSYIYTCFLTYTLKCHLPLFFLETCPFGNHPDFGKGRPSCEKHFKVSGSFCDASKHYYSGRCCENFESWCAEGLQCIQQQLKTALTPKRQKYKDICVLNFLTFLNLIKNS